MNGCLAKERFGRQLPDHTLKSGRNNPELYQSVAKNILLSESQLFFFFFQFDRHITTVKSESRASLNPLFLPFLSYTLFLSKTLKNQILHNSSCVTFTSYFDYYFSDRPTNTQLKTTTNQLKITKVKR